ncbi:hypothetical protein crov073 [Cafeteria roenbergensis virus]|uniref:Uncharacterized protein n=1 Tax=Cafeteria roenbergensis virus (strain BV-PW1) TaxID=693272 RepID=E3T4J3_CROVB|nr:hypothetical protein crov073 [Cafeteria roenbergensis virus BV-PW1]ADO67106.1 hypothetical protein crov073 [Cafeteria roenbergensis virus BV-PW1]
MNETSQIYEDLCKKVNSYYCKNTEHKLSDLSLLEQFKEQPSTIKKLSLFKDLLKKNKVNNSTINNILDDILPIIISAGTKGIIRGLEFNKIVKETILNLNLPNNLKINFEKKCDNYITDEIPDWYILDINTNKILVGMNQIDLWSGGAQLNRGYKYILQNTNTENKKIICVICKKPKITIENKCFILFNEGFKNNTLCYISNLKDTIYNFFNLKLD